MTYLDWLLIGLVCVLLELFVPGVYLVWFGLSAFVTAGVVGLFDFDITFQLVSFAFLSGIFALIGWRVYAHLVKKEPIPQSHRHLNDMAAAYIGKECTLAEDIVDGRGKVKIGDTVWIAASDEPLKRGDTVTVTSVTDGVILNIKK